MSDTLGVLDKELLIPPHSSLPVRFEFVARLVNAEYCRTATIKNM